MDLEKNPLRFLKKSQGMASRRLPPAEWGLRDDPFGRLVLIPIGSALAQLLLKCLSSRKTSACESSHWYRPVEEPVRCYNCSVRSPILERGWRDLARIIRPRPVPKAVMTHFHMSLLRQSIFAPGNELFVCHEVPVLKENASIRNRAEAREGRTL